MFYFPTGLPRSFILPAYPEQAEPEQQGLCLAQQYSLHLQQGLEHSRYLMFAD